MPAALIAATFAWMYVTWGALPQMAGVLYGVKPVAIAIVGARPRRGRAYLTHAGPT